MATKRKRARKKNPTKKRAHAKRAHKRKPAAAAPARRRRAKRANPKRSHARRTRRASRKNPRRRRSSKRSHRRNPFAMHHKARRRSSKRRHRRNAGIPVWALAGLAAALGLVTYAVANDGSFAITQRMDPTLATLQRNRYILGGIFTAAGLAVAAFLSPVLGAGVAAGGLAALAGTQASLALGKLIDKTNPDGSLQTAQPAAALPPAQTTKGLGAVYDGDQQNFGAVFGPGGQQFGAVFDGGAQMFSGAYDGDGSFVG